jgi:uncharacterized protein YbjQ (UPF0145 family)
MTPEIILLTTPAPPESHAQVGDFLFASSVCAANAIKDIRENIRNLTGGHLHHYEDLIEKSVARALERLQEKAQALGYNAIINVRISHPNVVDGAVSVTVYGNGCVFDKPQTDER